MGTIYPKGSAGEEDVKNSKKFEWIVIIASVVVTAICWLVAAEPFAIVHQHPIAWTIPALFVGWTIFCVIEVLKLSMLTEEAKWPYLILIALFVATIWAMFHCTTC